jgi:hypothetical protein
MHYEDLRGIYSRGPRPQEQPKKVMPVTPYYVNQFRYTTIDTFEALKQNGRYPLFRSNVTNWFEMKFRYEYLWESAELFPTNDVGKEILGMMQYDLLRIPRPQITNTLVRFDGGAWTGWKDDKPAPLGESDTNYKLHTNKSNIFQSTFMPLATGPVLDVTTDMVFHLVLVNERRASPLTI